MIVNTCINDGQSIKIITLKILIYFKQWSTAVRLADTTMTFMESKVWNKNVVNQHKW
jgi:hypothetical protein